MATNVSVEASSHVDIAHANVAMEAETTTKKVAQTTDDDEVQIVGETQNLSSLSVMMPTTMVPSTSPTTGLL